MAPSTTKKPAAKKVAKASGDKKKSKKSVESYKLYIFKVLKQVHPDTGISSKAMAILNSFIADMFDKIASQAAQVRSQGLPVDKEGERARPLQRAIYLRHESPPPSYSLLWLCIAYWGCIGWFTSASF